MEADKALEAQEMSLGRPMTISEKVIFLDGFSAGISTVEERIKETMKSLDVLSG